MPRISCVEAFTATLRLKEPIRIAYTEIRSVDTVYVRLITSNGEEGWGEAPPSPAITGETTGSILAAVRRASSVLAGEELAPSRLRTILDKTLFSNNSARSGVETALLDAYSRLLGVPLHVYLGAPETVVMKTDVTISLDEPDIMAENARRWAREGFDVIKLKLGGPPDKDLERVKLVREAVGGSVPLRVDANQAWNLPTAIKLLDLLRDLGVEVVEQPLDSEMWEETCVIRYRSAIPIIADESAIGAAGSMKAIISKCFDGINLKLAKLGGLYNSLIVGQAARYLREMLMIGCMAESRLGISAASTLAAAIPVDFIDLDSDMFIENDPVATANVRREKNTLIVTNNKPGLGVSVDPSALKREFSNC